MINNQSFSYVRNRGERLREGNRETNRNTVLFYSIATNYTILVDDLEKRSKESKHIYSLNIL